MTLETARELKRSIPQKSTSVHMGLDPWEEQVGRSWDGSVPVSETPMFRENKNYPSHLKRLKDHARDYMETGPLAC